MDSDFLSTPKSRVPSTSSQTTAPSSAPISTPSPPSFTSFSSWRKGDMDSDILNTPKIETPPQRFGDSEPETPGGIRPKRGRQSTGGKGGVTLTLRDQEKHIDSLKKENFNIKLRVHFLEDRLAQLAPDQMDAALKQNINLKIEVQSRGMEIKRLKKLLLELEKELERMQRQESRGRERELEEKLEERERELRELRRRKMGDHGDQFEAVREVEMRNSELEDELENARGLLEENMEEMERLREIVERRGDESTASESDGRSHKLRRRLADLEAENDDLRGELDNQAQIVATKEDENGDLLDAVDSLKLTVSALEQRLEASTYERSESRAQVLEEKEEREAVEDDLNATKDRFAAAIIELQQKEDEIDERDREIDNLMAEHERIVGLVNEEWRQELEEAKGRVEELKDVLSEREIESKELRIHIAELEANTDDLHSKFEEALAHLENEASQKDEEIDMLNETVTKLGDQIYELEEENDRLKEDMVRLKDDEGAERERLEGIAAVLKDKLANLRAELETLTEEYETCTQDILAHRERQEQLASHVEELVSQLESERELRERAENDLEVADNNHDLELRRERRDLEAKDSALQSALNDLARAQSLLTQRESDLAALQSALNGLESESKRAGESHTTAQFSLQLEVDRLRRDLERVESELDRARKDLAARDSRWRERDGETDTLVAENRDLTSKLASQTQARLNISEKLDSLQGALKAAEGEIASYKARLGDVEGRLSKDQGKLINAEGQWRDQLTERNTLLLTIYQYMDKILGVDKTPKKAGQAETKPFTNFSVFHDNLITRLKALSQIQLDFDRKVKEAESRFTEKMGDMRKQLDMRWKQIDKFEGSVKSYAETKAGWRKKFGMKEGELEAIRTSNVELTNQLASMKRASGPGDTMEIRSLNARALNAERRLNNAQNQLLAAEEKVANMSQRNTTADSKWEARVKEYETRLKTAEEKVKRERQGGKERIGELESNLKSLQRQLEVAQKRNQQLSDVVETNRPPISSTPR